MNSYLSIPYQVLPKICIIGDANVGKTSFISTIKAKYFSNNYTSTKFSISHTFKIDTNHGNIIFKIVDTPGNQLYMKLHPETNYAGVDVGLFFFDITSKSTFQIMLNFIKLFRNSRPNSQIIICGNKSDCNKRDITSMYISKHMPTCSEYLEISVKSGHNINKLIETLMRHIKMNEDVKLLPYNPPSI